MHVELFNFSLTTCRSSLNLTTTNRSIHTACGCEGDRVINFNQSRIVCRR